jgi:hypothetical protein
MKKRLENFKSKTASLEAEVSMLKDLNIVAVGGKGAFVFLASASEEA